MALIANDGTVRSVGHMKPRTLIIVAAVLVAFLAYTNPNEAAYRAHVQEREGVMGVLGLGLADLLSKNNSKGIHRDNYLVCSKFYVGGDGLLPRQDLAWGVANKFIELDQKKR